MLHRHRPGRGAFDLPIGFAIVAATAAAVSGCGGAAGASDPSSDVIPLAEAAPPAAVVLRTESGGAPSTGAAGAGVGPSSPAPADLSSVEQATSSPLVAGTGGASGTGAVTPPKIFYLAYSDGNALPASTPDACHGTAPKFICQFAPSLKECQRQIQTYLDDWYADFNVVFTLTRPTTGAFYTEVVSSGGGAWCSADSTTAGIAPFYCQDLTGGVAYAFMGGATAKETAIIIAQEQAHLVGLEHTKSERDLMHPTVCTACEGFENVDNKIDNDHCGRADQNSYQMMLDRLGPWPGGVKPSPFGCEPDVSAPSVAILQPAEGATVGANFQLTVQASDDCQVKTVSVSIDPLGLRAESAAPPFSWNLTRISGHQTITVTASDSSGKHSSASITVTAPGGTGGRPGADAGAAPSSDAGVPGSDAEDFTTAQNQAPAATGCELGGCDTSGRGTSPSTIATALAAIAVLVGRRRNRTRVVAAPAIRTRRR